MSTLAEELRHIKTHIEYPATRSQLVEACNRMSDVPTEDREWFTKTLPEGIYKGPDQVLTTLLSKV